MTNTLKFTTVNDSQNKNTEYHLRIKILKNITVTKSTAKFFIDIFPTYKLIIYQYIFFSVQFIVFQNDQGASVYILTESDRPQIIILLHCQILRIYLPTSCYQSPVLPLSIIKANFYGAVLRVHFTPLFHISYIFTAGHSIKLTRVKA